MTTTLTREKVLRDALSVSAFDPGALRCGHLAWHSYCPFCQQGSDTFRGSIPRDRYLIEPRDAVLFDGNERGEVIDADGPDEYVDGLGADVQVVKPRAVGSDPDRPSVRLVTFDGFQISEAGATSKEGKRGQVNWTSTFLVPTVRRSKTGQPLGVNWDRDQRFSVRSPWTNGQASYWRPTSKHEGGRCIALECHQPGVSASWSFDDQMAHEKATEDAQHAERDAYRHAWKAELTDLARSLLVALWSAPKGKGATRRPKVPDVLNVRVTALDAATAAAEGPCALEIGPALWLVREGLTVTLRGQGGDVAQRSAASARTLRRWLSGQLDALRAERSAALTPIAAPVAVPAPDYALADVD